MIPRTGCAADTAWQNAIEERRELILPISRFEKICSTMPKILAQIMLASSVGKALAAAIERRVPFFLLLTGNFLCGSPYDLLASRTDHFHRIHRTRLVEAVR